MSDAFAAEDEDDCLQSNFSRGVIATANKARDGLDRYDAACAIALSGRSVMHIPSSS